MRSAPRRIAAALGLCVALLPVAVRAEASVEGYPYFAKLLTPNYRQTTNDHVKVHDIAVTGSGDVILVGEVQSREFRVTNDIYFTGAVSSGIPTAFVLCMSHSGEWKWGVCTGKDSLGAGYPEAAALAVAVDENYAYVGGRFENVLHYSRLKPALRPDDEPDTVQELVEIQDTHQGGGGLWVPDGLPQGFILKLELTDGSLAGALRVTSREMSGSGTTQTSAINGIAVSGQSVYVCGDLSDSNEDDMKICGLLGGYNVQDGYFAARISKALTSCDWIAYGDDKGCGDYSNFKESDGTARGIVVDDAGDVYVCGAIGGGHPEENSDEPSSVWTSAPGNENPYFRILTGSDPDGSDQCMGTQSWFLLKVSAAGIPLAINYDWNQWDDDNGENDRPFSIAYDVALAGGKVYVAGTYNGFLRDPQLGAHDTIHGKRDNIADYNPDGFLVRCNTDLEADKILEIGTTAQVHDNVGNPDGILALAADTASERLYVFGHYGGATSFFRIPNETNVVELNTLGDQDPFMAAVDISMGQDQGSEETVNFKWLWARSTAQLDSYLPPVAATFTAAGIDLTRGRVFCAGVFNPTGDDPDPDEADGRDDQPLKLGTQAKLTTLEVTDIQADDRVGFLTAIDGGGDYFEQVTLEIACPLAEAVPHVSPGVGTFRYFQDSEITVTAPAAIYQKNGDEFVAENLEDSPADPETFDRRFVCSGYTIGDGIQSDAGTRYTTTLSADTKIKFNWERQFRLNIDNLIVAPAGAQLQDVELAALGSPSPPTGLAWIKEGTPVGPQVNGIGGMTAVGNDGLRKRYALTRFVGEGTAPATRSITLTEERLQFGDGGSGSFIMDGPADITYEWTRQCEVRVRVAKPSGGDMPLIAVTDGSGQADSSGTGDFWYAEGTVLRPGSRLTDPASGLQLTGWELAGTNVFPAARFVTGDGGSLTTHMEAVDLTGTTYMFLRGEVTLDEPFQVFWDYDDIIYYLNAALGQPLDRDFFNTTAINDANGPVAADVGDWIDFTRSPVVHQADGDSGSQMPENDMHIYDSVGQRSWLLQPGVAVLEWNCIPGNGPGETVVTKIHTGFPGRVPRELIYADSSPQVLVQPAAGATGELVIDKPAPFQAEAVELFKASFRYRWSEAPDPGETGHGFSFNYGVVPDDWVGTEEGIGEGITVRFDLTYPQMSVNFDGVTWGSWSTYGIGGWVTDEEWYHAAEEWIDVTVAVKDDGYLYLTTVGREHRVQLRPEYAPQPGWRFAFGGRCIDLDPRYMKQELADILITTGTDTAESVPILYADGAEHVLTDGSGQRTAILMDKFAEYQDAVVDGFDATFEVVMDDPDSNHADGLSFTYGPVSDTWPGSEDGPGRGLTVRLDTYSPKGVSVLYDDDTLVHQDMTDVYDRASDGATVRVACSGKRVTVYFDGVRICDRLPIAGFAPQSDWRFAFGARCGSWSMTQSVRNTVILATAGDLIPDYFGNPAAPGDTYPIPDPDPRRKHLADTPDVLLDVSTTDGIALLDDYFHFRPDPGAVGTQEAVIGPGGNFSSQMPGWSVLLFSQSTFDGLAATGNLTREELFTRVVRTEKLFANQESPTWWDDGGTGLLRHGASVEIGTKLASTFDTAGLGTGHLMSEIEIAPDGNEPQLNPPYPWRNYNPAIYDAASVTGPIIPVNIKHHADPTSRSLNSKDDLVVVWYGDDPDYEGEDASIAWPYQPVLYRRFHWPDQAPAPGNPTTKRRIVIASRLGSAGKDEAGNEQFDFDPERYSDVQVYNQPTRGATGFNPNEEHALIAPSFADLDSATPPPAAYALRNDLNVDDDPAADSYTSEPYVLVQYFDVEAGEHRMAVYEVQASDGATTDDRLPEGNQTYTFEYHMDAGQIVVAPYPLNLVIGATPINNTLNDDNPAYPDGTAYEDIDPQQRTWFVDHKGTGWAVSGNGRLRARYYYPFRTDFWLDVDQDGVADDAMAGDPVCWLPEGGPADNVPVGVEYPTHWPDQVPILKAGETLTYSGGEYRADHPDAPGLPGVIGWSAGQIVYDDLNPNMETLTDATFERRWTVRIVSPLEERRVTLDPLPETFAPAGGRVRVVGGEYQFTELSASLQRRVFYDSLTKELGIRGFVNDRTLGDSDLTAAPPAVYVLEANVLTPAEHDELLGLDAENGAWTGAVDELRTLCLNPEDLSIGPAGTAFLAGLRKHVDTEGNEFADEADPFRGFGPGLAVIPNQGFLDPTNGALPDEAYVTLAENNDDSLGAAPVSMHIVKVSRKDRYRGSVKTILGPNAFDEKIVLRHTGDFGTHTGDLVYQWFIREEDGTEQPLPATASPDPWQYFRGGLGTFQVSLEGTGPVILRDNLVFCRYAHRNEQNDASPPKPVDETTDWSGTEWDGYFEDHAYTVGGTEYRALGEWAGAGNSPTVDGDFLPQLVMGWVKRVLDRINPYEARISDFTNSESPATYTSMIQQFGPRYEGPVALNPDKDVIENHGLIELYTTVLERAKDLSIDLSQPANSKGVIGAILLAATRVAQFQTILGHEAWCDAMDPTIGIGSGHDNYGSLATSMFSFENQLPALLDEELALLRGVDTSYARPVYNRLFWNFTKERGEAAYASNYNITDVNADGFIDEDDAMKLFPQGHGDAWGHYLAALKVHYDLLNHSYFNWHARSELYNLMDIVIPVDFFDERHFAETAAAKARAGVQICRLTYRDMYVDDPDGQWAGYTDTDADRAWGLDGWTRRAGQGAYFDWLTANAITPPPEEGDEGIEAVNRDTISEIAEISEQMGAVQQVLDDAGAGVNPLGVHPDVVPFDIEPALIYRWGEVSATHFDQIVERAQKALDNARLAFDHANQQTQRLRQIADSAAAAVEEAEKQDLAFRNRLIEIFGTPYPEHIGAGKPYPAGYDGPDILLYMYVDRTAIARLDDSTKESIAYGFDVKTANLLDELPTDPKGKDDDDPRYAEDKLAGDLPGKYELQQLKLKQELKAFWEDIYNQSYENSPWLPFAAFHDDIDDLELPVTAEDYAYQAPEQWGRRRSVGKLQRLISDLVIADVDFTFATWEYVGTIKDINYSWASLKADLEYQTELLEAKETIKDAKLYREKVVYSLNEMLAWVGYAEQLVSLKIKSFKAGSPIGRVYTGALIGPTGGNIVINSISVPDRYEWTSQMISDAVFGGIKTVVGEASRAMNYTKTRDALEFGYEIDKLGLENNLRQKLLAFNRKLGTEHGGYLKAFQGYERYNQLADEYRTTLEEAFRVLEERGNWNRKLARRTQQNRYNDMVLRVYRNDALQKYHDAFDLAARYVYLAAKAYDYETNLDGNDPASAAGVLDDIVAARTLGAFEDGEPVIGVDGLADCLARLKSNYDVLRGQMGFDNPQVETDRFSLRTECFRIHETGWVDPDTGEAADELWRNRLEDCRVDDLWDVWEFRHFCRPMAGYDPDLPEPGIVIRFPTQILSRYNFFGHRLGPGDHSYDPSHFATKIRSTGIWLTDYDNSALAETPRVYLVPAGADIMTIPTSGDLEIREWNVVHQRIPVPYALTDANLEDPTFIPANDTLDGTFSDIVRFAGLRAYFDGGVVVPEELTYNTRLVGRSVWNTEWLLIIPGSALLFDAEEGIQRFIYGRFVDEDDPGLGRDGKGVSDVKLTFQTYSHPGT